MADNDGLIGKEIDHLGYTHPYPNITLEPKFDLVEEIYATHQWYHITASFQHVKGHQDRSKELATSQVMNTIVGIATTNTNMNSVS